MPNCNRDENIYKCMETYDRMNWTAYGTIHDAEIPNPLLQTDAIYMYNFVIGNLLEDDIPKLENFLCEHVFPYRLPVYAPCFIPKRKYGCSCLPEYHMQALAYVLITKHQNNRPRETVPKFSDYPEMAANKYCKRTCYGYYGIDQYCIVQYYLPRKELNLNYPYQGTTLCYVCNNLPLLSNYTYHERYTKDV